MEKTVYSDHLKSLVLTIESDLKNCFNNAKSDYIHTIYEVMRYSLEAGGKRLRPVFLIETARIFGMEGKTVRDFACAIEMIHTYSLIHDDLPAMDDDALRRGKPTSHIQFDEAKAILGGDGLLNSAHTLMIGSALQADNKISAMEAAYEISHKAGVEGMIVGQIADIENEKNNENRQIKA